MFAQGRVQIWTSDEAAKSRQPYVKVKTTSLSCHHQSPLQKEVLNMQPVSLLYLADELLILILNAVNSRSDLYSIIRVCRRLSSLAEPCLYASVLLRDIEDSTSFLGSLAKNPDRALQIRSLELDFSAREEFEPVTIIPWLSSMSSLQDLIINSSDEENDGFGEVFNRALAPELATNLLWSLRSCTLRYWDEYGEFWSLSNKIAIFFHPTLQCLTIINAQAEEWAMSDLSKQTQQTSLEELHFHRCDIHAQSLADMLALPRALKRLTIGQNHGYPPIENSPADMNDYVAAMRSQYKSLEILTIIRGTEFRHSPLKLENLTALRRLEIDPRVLFTPLNTPIRIANVAAGVTSILPAGLEELVLLDLRDGDFKSLMMMLHKVLDMKAEEKIVPALQRIIFRIIDHLQPPPWIIKASVAAKVLLVTEESGGN